MIKKKIKQSSMDASDLLPDIEQYLESINHGSQITIKGLEEILNKVKLKTNLNDDAIKIITILFFQEIRNAMLRGDIVILRKLGKFYISSPKISGNKVKITPKFFAYPKIIRMLNGR